ncbi:SMI1/KNR4 family protein [Tenacibaculum maritimum]|uniref:SMI1/KNR4 family protein n=1 Tax=Tenacibaculum maritimum TaxID=107401 RepID=UPI0012E4E5BC|nr:SMI1/KNR4 family protein [Tenacibaculum maritimum]MCD9563101.1 SMI1/KNR4 family protein [Tenacibaculum maritimum]MCD9567123.1 SMI1/KNR4 family protein [Tenacibaculum maritimum]MCD9579908.1 SMI1/KNR4 family protein [Tenacibaculum maritimum]MCD9597287.1 SMI1/KNR4 family protein [Tenacibaculum maritimum]MCD9614487.1 SMI1/KNR4 family protein [Tenacibaculum maritimum]
MEIKYLKKLVKNSTIRKSTIRGVSEEKINKVEKKFNIKFPQAYREFLFLAGDYCGALPLYDTADLETLASDWHQEIMHEVLGEYGTKIERPFWLYAESNGCEQFVFFYLDEGDDPYIYVVDYDDNDDSKQIIKKSVNTFSKGIEGAIEQAYDIVERGLW